MRPTAFDARFGSGELVLAFCAEYDALPGIGHACGHNIIGASAVGAGIGLAALADELGVTVRVIGTPAEETGGGKVLMLERGVFDGVGAAMMVHPGPFDITGATSLALADIAVEYDGREAHASAAPELVLAAHLDEATLGRLFEAMMAAFGPVRPPSDDGPASTATASFRADVTRITGELWQRINPRAERRLRDLCEIGSLDPVVARATAHKAMRRAGLFACGDLALSLKLLAKEDGQQDLSATTGSNRRALAVCSSPRLILFNAGRGVELSDFRTVRSALRGFILQVLRHGRTAPLSGRATSACRTTTDYGPPSTQPPTAAPARGPAPAPRRPRPRGGNASVPGPPTARRRDRADCVPAGSRR